MQARILFLAAISLMPSLGVGCGTTDSFVNVDELPKTALAPAPYRIQNGDKLVVSVWNQLPLSGEQIVRPDGNITMPLIGDVAVSGLTPSNVSQEIARRLTGLVIDPKVSVSVAATREASISVVGEVRDAGTYPLRPGEGVLELLARSGGLSEFANKDRIFVIRRAGEPMRVRFKYDALARGEGAGIAFTLQDGDILVVE